MSDPSPKLLTVDLATHDRYAFNAANTLLVVGSREDDVAVILDVADGHEVARVEGIALHDLEAFEFYGDKLLAIRDGACVFYDVRRRKFETVFAEDGLYPQSATVDPTGRWMAIGVTLALILFDLKKKKVFRRLETGIRGAPLYPAFSPGGRFVAADFITEAYGNVLIIWDVVTGKRWRTLEIGSQGLAVAFRGDTLTFVLGQDGLELYEPDQGDEPVARYARPLYPQAITFRDGGKTLAAVGGHQEGLVVLDVATGKVKQAIDHPAGHEIGNSAPSPDWSLIASGTDAGVLVWPSGLGKGRAARKGKNV